MEDGRVGRRSMRVRGRRWREKLGEQDWVVGQKLGGTFWSCGKRRETEFSGLGKGRMQGSLVGKHGRDRLGRRGERRVVGLEDWRKRGMESWTVEEKEGGGERLGSIRGDREV